MITQKKNGKIYFRETSSGSLSLILNEHVYQLCLAETLKWKIVQTIIVVEKKIHALSCVVTKTSGHELSK